MTITSTPIPLDSTRRHHSDIVLELDRDWWPDELRVVSSSPVTSTTQDDSKACQQAVRLTRAMHIIIIETMAGRRPMNQLMRASSPRATATMRTWPRGPGWSRMLLVGEPQVSFDEDHVDGVGLIDLRGRRLPLATNLVQHVGVWHLEAVELVLNPRVAALLSDKHITQEAVGMA
ncbi:Rv3235 family protein [Cutibacterium sp. V947]|uniref:Rv3235 family protein n=1 Tax=unclassified Cutibacterium TaxID=2649671 RepID=UPI003EE19DA7